MIRLAVTPGEPAGIGPELVVRFCQQPLDDCELVAICNADLLQQTAALLELELTLHVYDANLPRASGRGHLSLIDLPLAKPVQAGQLNAANSPHVLAMLATAADRCLLGELHGLVTGPVHKGIINDAGVAFSGHTEFFAERAGCEHVVMMLATEGLRVALATTHLPLKDVAAAITEASLIQAIEILDADLKLKFGIAQPRILVCGLNPHAGEGGHLGREEIDVITPVLEQLRGRGLDLHGPLPADTLFTPHHLDQADAVLAMYHDQGLPVLKFKGFGRAVNITLGLPFIRTSVDHGTALDLAGKGRANLGSFAEAVAVARQMAQAHFF